MTLLRFLVLWVLAGGAEFPLLANFLGMGSYPATLAWGCHGISAVLAALAVVHRDGLFNLSQRWTWWIFLWVLLLPGAGLAFGGILVGTGWKSFTPKAGGYEEDELATTISVVLPKLAEASSIRIAKELDFVPLVELLAGDDLNLKRGAVEQLTRLRTPEAIQVLMSHRSDPSMEMRFYVNSSLVQIKKELDEGLDAARYQMRMDVDNVADRLNLARIYLLYVRSGLLDSDLKVAYEKEAFFHLTFVLNSNTPTREAVQMLIMDQIQLRNWDRVEETARKAHELKLISDAELAEYRAEILYYRKQFGKIVNELRSISNEPSLSADWQSTLLWWGVET